MSQLLDMVENFKVSRPVFALKVNSDNVEVKKVIHEYRPQPIPGDYLSELVCGNFKERFSPREGSFHIDISEIVSISMQEIRSSIPKFIEKNLEMRNPRQSKLYRWDYRNMPNSSELNDVLIMVYKYLRSFSDSDMKANDPNHTNNAIALLDAIKDKYER